MNTVTFETAKALKGAGFPQPEFKTGQFWYNAFGALSVIGKKEVADNGTDIYFFCISLATGRQDRMIPIHDGAIYAPTADDILKDLQDCSLTFYGGKYLVLERDTGNGKSDWGDNPAELAAGVWLEVRNGELINSENGDDQTSCMPKDGTYIMTFDPETTSIA